MDELLPLLVLALFPAAGNVAGGILAEYLGSIGAHPELALHVAVGLMLAIVATELLPEASTVLPGWTVGAAFRRAACGT